MVTDLLAGDPDVRAIWKRCAALNQWLAAHQDGLPKSLALDGNDLGHNLGAIVEIDTEVSPFPHHSQIIKETRIYRSTKEGAEPVLSERLFGTSHRPGERTEVQLCKMIRGHWSVENLNDWKRDATLWQEDRAPKRAPRGAKNLALIRNALARISHTERA